MPPHQSDIKTGMCQRCANTLHSLVVRKIIGYGKYKVVQMKELEDKYKRSSAGLTLPLSATPLCMVLQK